MTISLKHLGASRRTAMNLQRAIATALKWEHVGSSRSFQGRRAVREEFGREPTAIQDGSLLHVLLAPCDGLPGRVEDQVAAIAIELHPVAARLEHVQEQRLGDAVLAGA